MGDKKLKKKKTVTKKGDINPVWNEAFSFAVPHRILHRITLHCSVKHQSDRGKERVLGKVILGTRSSEKDVVDHWNAMTTSEKAIAKWHLLEEDQPASRRGIRIDTTKGIHKESQKGRKKSQKEVPKESATEAPNEGLPEAPKEGPPQTPKEAPPEGPQDPIPEEIPQSESPEIESQPEKPPQTE